MRNWLVLAVLLCAVDASAQSTATITTKTCTLTMSADKSPDGTSGWSIQFRRNTDNHGTKDTTAPYGPKSATVDAGTYVLTAIWTKTGQATKTEQVGTAKCEGGSLLVVPPLPAPTPVPAPTPTPQSAASADGTLVPPATGITDSAGHVWTLGAAPDNAPTLRYVLCDGHPAVSGYAAAIRYLGGVVSIQAADQQWYPVQCGSATGSVPPPSSPPSTTGTPTNVRLLTFQAASDYSALISRVVLELRDMSGALAKSVELGKPSADATGQVAVPVSLTLTAGTYQAVVGACSEVTCAYSMGVSVVF